VPGGARGRRAVLHIVAEDDAGGREGREGKDDGGTSEHDGRGEGKEALFFVIESQGYLYG